MNKSNSNGSKSKNPLNQSQRQTTEGVTTLLGDPKKAILKLSIPMIIAMSVNTVYNFVDAIWVSGLGKNALAAIGFYFPFFFMAMAIGAGIGIGGGAAISRKIGAKDKVGSDNVAVHTMVIMMMVGVIFTIPFFFFAENIFINIGAGEVTNLVVSYGRIMFGGTLILFFIMVGNFILRAEGDAKRSMYAMMLGAGLNIVLDPIFIFGPNHQGPWIFDRFGLDQGVAGAAWATMLSFSITAIIMFYWLFFKRDTYVSFNFHAFKFKKSILSDISRVGLPATIMQVSMAITMLIINLIIVFVGGEEGGTVGIAIFTAGWRVITIGILPLLGIATAVTSVTGAAFGAKNIKKLKTALHFAIKMGIIIELIVASLMFIFAPQIASIFTKGEDAIPAEGLILFLRINCLFIPGVALGMLSSAMFQGTGKGIYSLLTTILRTIILTTIFGIVFAIYLNWDLLGVWVGIVLANLIGSIVAFLWGMIYINNLKKKFDQEQ